MPHRNNAHEIRSSVLRSLALPNLYVTHHLRACVRLCAETSCMYQLDQPATLNPHKFIQLFNRHDHMAPPPLAPSRARLLRSPRVIPPPSQTCQVSDVRHRPVTGGQPNGTGPNIAISHDVVPAIAGAITGTFPPTSATQLGSAEVKPSEQGVAPIRIQHA